MDEIIDSVKCVHSTASDNETRSKAYTKIELFMQSDPVQVGSTGFSLLGAAGNSSTVRHFGLQAIESVVKYHWNDLTTEFRLEIKTGLMELARNCRLEDESLISDRFIMLKVADCIVEIVKREWPQHWPGFIVECEKLLSRSSGDVCNVGTAGVVLYLWAKLVEDVSIFKTVPGSKDRVKDLSLAVVNSLPCFISNCNRLIAAYLPSINQTKVVLVIKAVLNLLNDIFDANFRRDYGDNGELFSNICHLIEPNVPIELRQSAAHVLGSFGFSRSGLLEDRLACLKLLEPELIGFLIKLLHGCAQMDHSVDIHQLMTAVLQIFGQLANHLAFIMTPKRRPENFHLPSTFGDYFGAIVAFLNHPSLEVRSAVMNTISVLVKSPEIGISVEFQAQFHPAIFSSFRGLLTRYSSLASLPEPDRSVLVQECGSDTEFLVSFAKVRSQAIMVVTALAEQNPLQAMVTALEWMDDVMPRIASTSLDELEGVGKLIELAVPLFAKSEGLVGKQPDLINYLDMKLLPAFSSLFQAEDHPRCIHLLNILCCWMHFVDGYPARVLQIAERLFASCNKGEDTYENNLVVELRHAATHLLVKICLNHERLMIPYLPHMLKEYERCVATGVYGMRSSLAEGITIVGLSQATEAEFGGIVSEIMAPVVELCRPSGSLALNLLDHSKFLSCIGLTSPPPKVAFSSSEHDKQRREIYFVCSTVLCLIRRGCRWGAKGAPTGRESLIFNSVLPCLDTLFGLCRSLNSLYNPASVSAIHPGYGPSVLDCRLGEKYILMGLSPERAARDRIDPVVDGMHTFLIKTNESLFQSVGLLMGRLSIYFWALPVSSAYFVEGCLAFLDQSIDYRLRMLLRWCFKTAFSGLASGSFWSSLPPGSVHSSLFQSVYHCILLYYDRLRVRWEEMDRLLLDSEDSEMVSDQNGVAEGSLDKNDKVLDICYFEQMTRHLSGDFADLLATFLFFDGKVQESDDPVTANGQDTPVVDDSDEMGESKAVGGNKGSKLSSAAIAMLNDEQFSACLINPVFSMLAWRESACQLRVARMAAAISEQLLNNGRLTEQMATYMLYSLLAAFQLHGEHETILGPLVAIAMEMYGMLRVAFPATRMIMTEIPGISISNLDNYDQKFVLCFKKGIGGANNQQSSAEQKIQKRKFNELIEGIVGKNVGQIHRRQIQMRDDLPPLIFPVNNKGRRGAVAGTGEQLDGLAALFADCHK